MGVGTPKKKIVRRKNETETARAMVKKLAKTKLIRAVRLRDFLEEGIFDLVADGRRELGHVAVPRRGFVMYEENGIVRLLARSLAAVGRYILCFIVFVSETENGKGF